jgi:hypothetical protein
MQHPVLGRFMQRDPMGYVDGMSLYEYVKSEPVEGVDPTGFDRYVGSTIHKYLAVDTWKLSKNKAGCLCWEKTGIVQYDMSVRAHNTGWTHGIFNLIAGIVVADGEVVRGPYLGDPDYTISSTPEGDQRLKDKLDEQADDTAGNSGHSPYYSAIFYNCRDWVSRWQNYMFDYQPKVQIPMCP